jgi:AcrR family transcriptional regulator
MKENKKKDENENNRKRRRKSELNEIIWDALKRMIIRDGFNHVTLVGLAREAGVEPPVIYNRFENVDDLFNQYALSQDYWLREHQVILDPGLSLMDNFIQMLHNLVDNLYDNEITQRLLLWELNDTNKITRHLAMRREFESGALLEYLNNGLQKCGIHINIATSIMIAGIYYLIMHKAVSTFCLIDYNRKESREQLKQTLTEMVNKLFVEKNGK